ncbi:MAG: DNA repair protein RecN [Flavobacteriaceae bacterium]|nr:DNA repair protein RecN [Flavobacteriaceae bacterium]
MLTELRIKNFALIKELTVSFSSGMSCITGETGAGKSILLGGLSLVLGKRADISLLNDLSKKCIIEAVFQIRNYDLKKFFSENNLDYFDETILRREVLPNGKSRAFINDTPVKISMLENLSINLIDIHSQNEKQLINQESYQFSIVDSFAQNKYILNDYKIFINEYNLIKDELENLKRKRFELNKSFEYKKFIYDELLNANLPENFEDDLEYKYRELSNVEEIKENLRKSISLLENEQIGLINNLIEFRNVIKDLNQSSNKYLKFKERSDFIYYELIDFLEDFNKRIENLDSYPEELLTLENRINEINTLLNKHKLKKVSELIELREELRKEIKKNENIDQYILSVKKKKRDLETKLNNLSREISKKRKAVIPSIESDLKRLTNRMGMKDASFKIELTNSETFLYNGKESITFYFKANKGTDFKLLKKIASGGEISRIMLSIKNIISKFKKLPTIIFDEIDSGVSGKISDSIADIMYELSVTTQVFTITHLPQVASKGDNHFKVFKNTNKSNTNTFIKRLNKKERINEIALMLSGNKITDTAKAHAKQLLN